MLKDLSEFVVGDLCVIVIRTTTRSIAEEVTSNWVDRRGGLIFVIEDCLSSVGNAVVLEGIAQRSDREWSTLCLGEVFLVVSC